MNEDKRPVGRPSVEHTQKQIGKALVTLAANQGNIKQASQELEISPYHLGKIRDANKQLYESIRQRITEGIFDKTLYMASKYADEIIRRIEDEDEIKDLKIRDLGVIFGIAVDKVNVMSTVQGKFVSTQRAAEDYSKLTDEELQAVIEGEYTELKLEEEAKDEGMPDTPEDELHAQKRRISPAGTLLHRSGDTKP